MAPQRSQRRGAVWAHLYLLLGERILALRERQTRWDESSNEDTAPLLGSAESQDWDFPPGDGAVAPPVWTTTGDGAVAPPVWTKGGCRPLQKNGCEWLQCKYKEYKTGLLAKKNQNEAEAKTEMHRVMTEEDWQRLVEDRFLAQHITKHLVFKAMAYWRKGLLLQCSWALAQGAENFEGWLQQLLPWRYACVTGVVSTFEPEKELCSEGFTNYFKEKLHNSCKPEGSSEMNPYKLADKKNRWAAGLSLAGGVTFSVVAGIVMMFVATLPFAAVAALAAVMGLLLTGTFAFAAVTVVRLYCKGKKKKEQKHAVRELSPSSQ